MKKTRYEPDGTITIMAQTTDKKWWVLSREKRDMMESRNGLLPKWGNPHPKAER